MSQDPEPKRESLRLLIVDDSPEDAALLARELSREFETEYRQVRTGGELQEALERENWQLVLAEHDPCGFDGPSPLEILQARGVELPLIIVTHRDDEALAVAALRAGARDVLEKTKIARLIPAVRRTLTEAALGRERTEAREKLTATEARLSCLVQQSLVGIFMLEDDRFSDVNPKFAKMFGYGAEDLVGCLGLMDLVAESDQIRVLSQFLRPLKDWADCLHISFQAKTSVGALIDLEVTGSAVRIDNHTVIIGNVLDVTERKHAEEELNKLWRAVEQSPVAVVITDLTGSIEYVNPKFCEVTGYEEREIVGRNPRILKSGTMDQAFYQDLWQTITSGGEWHGEMQNKKKNGALFWESTSISAVKNSEGRITHFVAVKEDITERRRGIDQLRQAQKMEAIGQLAGGVAHDFNNLLTIINGYSTLLIRGLEEGNPRRREAEQILRAGERAAELTRQLLGFSRRQIMEPKVLNMNNQVRTIKSMLERLIGENLTLSTALDEQVGLVKIDPGQVEQIVMNLVVNARDASDTGGVITIETGNFDIDEQFRLLHPGAVPGRYVRLTVSDTGYGMSEEVKRRIFEPFFTTKEMGRGTGLGLATVYGIVKQSNGYIEVQSEPDRGTAFNIFLPRIFREEEGPRRTLVDEQTAQGSQTILVVEDEPGVLNLVVHTLEKQGFNILQTTDPIHGVALFDEHRDEIDLLLTDVVMPFMSGPKLADTLMKKNPKLKVLFMSGHTENRASFEQILERGVPFLPKPFASDALVRKVVETLGDGGHTETDAPGGNP